MLSFRRITNLVFNQPTRRIAMSFSGNNWKDRDEAAEKVYVSQAESNTYLIQSKLSRNCSRKSRLSKTIMSHIWNNSRED